MSISINFYFKCSNFIIKSQFSKDTLGYLENATGTRETMHSYVKEDLW